ncbi:MAG: hypothetical protein P8X96_19335 [Desulfobacteraceae bacterium]
MILKPKPRRILKIITKILIWSVALAALGLTIRWLWLKWRAFGGVLIPWWRETIADPVLRLIVDALIAVDGDAFQAIALVALASWLLGKLLSTSAIKWSAGNLAKHPRVAFDQAMTSMEDIHTRLRKMFADDVEKIAFYENRLETPKRTSSFRRYKLVGCSGCLVGVLWILISIPVSFAINLAVFRGLLGIFGGQHDQAWFLAAAGPKAQILESYLPQSNNFIGIDLQERSLLLLVLFLVISLIYWLSYYMSKSGRTIPCASPWWLWAIAPILGIIIYLLLNGALILFSCLFLTISLLETVWQRLIWPKIYFPLRAQLHLSKEPKTRSE